MSIAVFVTLTGTYKFNVTVVRKQEDRVRGLLGVGPEFTGDVGMVFDFSQPTWLTMTMDGMRIPIDIIFVDAWGRVVDVVADARIDSGNYVSAEQAQWAVELPAGTARRIGLSRGATFRMYETVRS
jgi:hypothetical protein